MACIKGVVDKGNPSSLYQPRVKYSIKHNLSTLNGLKYYDFGIKIGASVSMPCERELDVCSLCACTMGSHNFKITSTAKMYSVYCTKGHVNYI